MHVSWIHYQFVDHIDTALFLLSTTLMISDGRLRVQLVKIVWGVLPLVFYLAPLHSGIKSFYSIIILCFGTRGMQAMNQFLCRSRKYFCNSLVASGSTEAIAICNYAYRIEKFVKRFSGLWRLRPTKNICSSADRGADIAYRLQRTWLSRPHEVISKRE